MPGRKGTVGLLSVFLAGSWASQAEAGPRASPDQRAAGELSYHLAIDLSVIAASIGAFASIRVFNLAPNECRWCERSDLNEVDRWFRDSFRDLDGTAMDVTGVASTALLPLATIGLNAVAARRAGRNFRTVGVDSLIVVESATIALALTAAVKVAAARQRPYTLTLPEEEVGTDPDQNASFFSGHTALGFSLAVSAGTVASMRGYRLAPAVWAVGLAAASAAGFSRLTGDEHFFTDLVAGGAAGAGVGLLVPWQLHRPRPLALTAIRMRGTSGLGVQGVF